MRAKDFRHVMAKVMALRRMGGPTRAMAASYDPEGLFAGKARVKTKLGAVDRPQWLRDLKKVPADACDASGGAPVVALEPHIKEELAKLLAQEYLPVDLDAPGLKVHHLDPPVLTVDGFLTPAECDLFVEETLRSETLKRSTVGEGNLDSERNLQSETRTSRSVLLSKEVQTEHQGLKDLAQKLQTRAKQIFQVERWSPTGVLPGPDQVCFEALQVAVYKEGEHFLSHEDGFPQAVVESNGFQRVATVLLYLNDVEVGGRTRFNFLDLAVQPRKGTVLLFFPGFSNCESDPRSVHTAEDAVDEKWVCQQWIARGLPVGNPLSDNGPSVGSEVQGELFRQVKKGKGKAAKGKKGAASRGFGAR